MNIAADVQRHYTHGALLTTILAALQGAGRNVETLDRSDLAGADEFHLGWQAATVDLATDLQLSRGTTVLDIGSGLGGPARHFADVFGAKVTGIDLTQEYVDVAGELTRRCGLADRATFHAASALEMPFGDAMFERATLIHVGMNIDDKDRLFAEVRRVLRPGGLFAVYDIMQVAQGELPYPMPWAITAATSFVGTPETYRRSLAYAGFEVVSEANRAAQALELGRKMRERAAVGGAPPLSLHTLMGPATSERLGNVMATLAAGTIAPIQIIARAI